MQGKYHEKIRKTKVGGKAHLSIYHCTLHLLLESGAVVEGGALLEGAGGEGRLGEGGGRHAGALAGVMETLGLAELLVLLQQLLGLVHQQLGSKHGCYCCTQTLRGRHRHSVKTNRPIDFPHRQKVSEVCFGKFSDRQVFSRLQAASTL